MDDDSSMVNSLDRWACPSCQTLNTAFEFYCVACNSPGDLRRDLSYVHITGPIPQSTDLPFQSSEPVELPFSDSHPPELPAYPDQETERVLKEDYPDYRPQPYNPGLTDKDTFGGPCCFIPLQNDVYLDEKHLIESIGRGQDEWMEDPIPRPHAPGPIYDHEDTVIMPAEYDYSFMLPQEIEQLHSIKAFFNNSLGVVPEVRPPSPTRQEGEEMRFSLTESAKYEFLSRHHAPLPNTQLYPRLNSISDREDNWALRSDNPDIVIPASGPYSEPDVIIIEDDTPTPIPRKHIPPDHSVPPVPIPRKSTSSLPTTIITNPSPTKPARPPPPVIPTEHSMDSTDPAPETPRRRKNTAILQAKKLDAVSSEGKVKIDEIISFLREQRINFIDPSFFPSPKSLFINPHTPRDMVQKVAWLRPGEISTRAGRLTKWSVFKHPNPADVYQGTLGNCWFLSALSVVAEKEQLIENLILTQELNQQGIYQVRLCMCGEWQVVTIDDYFPCGSRSKRQLYSEAVRNQLWMCLIEKAAAKLYGCYEALNKGTLIEGLSTLTGAPCETLPLLAMIQEYHANQTEARELIWAQITHFKQSHFLMGASTGNSDISEEVYRSVGLSAYHAYAVLDVSEMEGNRLVCLRDPNGVSRWKGDWSQNSPKWTHAMKQKLIPGGEEGIFWISIDDLCNYFTTVDVCKVRLDYNEARESAIFPPFLECHSPAYLVEVFDKTEFDIALYQPNKRIRQNDKNEHVTDYATEPTDLSVIVLRTFVEGSQDEGQSAPFPTKLVGFIDRKRQACVSHSFYLEAGHYLIVPQAFCHWDSDYIIPYTIATFSSKAHILESKPTRPGFLAECLIMLAKTKGNSLPTGSSPIALYRLQSSFNGALFVVENKSDYHFNIQLKDSGCQNVKSTRQSISTQDCVPPHHKQVLNIISISDPSRGYAISFQYLKSVTDQNLQGEYGSICSPELTPKNSELHNPIFI